jgi:hypothetical protein
LHEYRDVLVDRFVSPLDVSGFRGVIYKGLKEECRLSGTVANLDDVLPGINISNFLPHLIIMCDNAKRNGSHYLTYDQCIWDCSAVAEVLVLLITDPDGYDNMFLIDKSHITININGEDTFHIKLSALLDDPMYNT